MTVTAILTQCVLYFSQVARRHVLLVLWWLVPWLVLWWCLGLCRDGALACVVGGVLAFMVIEEANGGRGTPGKHQRIGMINNALPLSLSPFPPSPPPSFYAVHPTGQSVVLCGRFYFLLVPVVGAVDRCV